MTAEQHIRLQEWVAQRSRHLPRTRIRQEGGWASQWARKASEALGFPVSSAMIYRHAQPYRYGLKP